MTSLSTALASLLHVTIHGVSRDSYSVEKGHVRMAILIYFLHYLCHSFTLVGNLKFIAVAIERELAFKRRMSYENGQNRVGKFVAGGTVCLFFGENSFKKSE